MSRTLTGIFIAGLLLTALMSAHAQDATPTAPEATPFPPESTVVPEGAVFTAPGNCAVSPDESQIALHGYAIFSLPAGEKLYDIQDDYPIYSFDGRYFSTLNGVYEAATGEQVIPQTLTSRRSFSPNNRFFVDDSGVYDLESGAIRLPLRRLTTPAGQVDVMTFTPHGDIQVSTLNVDPTTFVSTIREVVYDAETLAVILDTDNYDFPLLREGKQNFSLIRFSPDGSYVAIFGVGLFSYPELELLYPVPAYREEWQFLGFSLDNRLLMSVGFDDEVLSTGMAVEFIDIQTRQSVNRFTFPLPSPTAAASEFTVSPNLDKIAIAQRDADGVLLSWQIIDVRTEEILAEIDGPNPESAVFMFLYDIDENGNSPYYALPEMIVDGRYAVNFQGIFDAETDQLILPLVGLKEISLSEGGTYAVTQRPCVVWNLP